MRDDAAAWQEGRLGDHADVRARIGWRGLSASEYTTEGPYLIAGKHIVGGRVDWDHCDHLNRRRYDESVDIALEAGDVIISKDGTLGRTARIDSLPGEATINGTMMLIRCREALDYRFLAHYLNGHAFRQFILDKESGSSIPHIFQRDMVTLILPLPSLPEQKRIAQILDTVDDVISSTKRLIVKLERIKSGLLCDLLTRGLNGVGERYDPLREAQLSVQQSGGILPAGWVARRLEELAPANRPHLKTGPFGSALKGSDWVATGVPVVTIGSLGADAIIADELLFISEHKAKALAAYALEAGDLVFSRVADVGRSIVIREDQSGWIMSSNLMRIAVDNTVASPQYIHHALTSSPFVRQQIRASVNAGGRDVVTDAILNRLLIPMPPLEEQNEIVARVEASTAAIRDRAAEWSKLRQLKTGVMDDLLSGRVRVTHGSGRAR
jgi:type I restriction enzyme S subunit